MTTSRYDALVAESKAIAARLAVEYRLGLHAPTSEAEESRQDLNAHLERVSRGAAV